MTVLFWIIVYIVIAAAAIFGLIVAASKADILCRDPEFFDLAGYVIFGILWPLGVLPCLAYIGARWYIENQGKD